MRIVSFEGLTAVVTGAGSGIGRELALQLFREGANLALCDINIPHLEETKSLALKTVTNVEHSNNEQRILIHNVDVRNVSQIDAFHSATAEKFGEKNIHLLFNIAGIGRTGTFLDMSPEEFDTCFDIGFKGVVNMTRKFLPAIIQNEKRVGFVANMSSVYGLSAALFPAKEILPGIVNPGITSYASSKHAVKGFTEALLLEAKSDYPHIGVGCIHPGYIATHINTSGDELIGHSKTALVYFRHSLMKGKGMTEAEVNAMSDEQIIKLSDQAFKENISFLPADAAAKQILRGVRNGDSKILVADDAIVYDLLARLCPVAMQNEYFGSLITVPWARSAGLIGRFTLPGVGVFAFPVVLSIVASGITHIGKSVFFGNSRL